MDLEKLKKDRKILRGIDDHVASRSTLVAFAYFFVCALVGWWGGLMDATPKFMITMGVLLTLPMVCRAYFTLRFEQSYGAAPGRWRHTFMVLHLLHAVIYALLCFVAIVMLPDPRLKSLLLILTIGIILVSCEIWRPFRRVNEAYTAICLTPFVVGALLQATVVGLMLATAVVVIFLNQVRVIKRSYDDYWWGLYHGFLLK